jgi:hypothetical protein
MLTPFSFSQIQFNKDNKEGPVIVVFSQPSQKQTKQKLFSRLVDCNHLLSGYHILDDMQEIESYKKLSCSERYTEYWCSYSNKNSSNEPSERWLRRLNASLKDQQLYSSTNLEYGLDPRTFTIFDNVLNNRWFFQKYVVKTAFVDAHKTSRMVILNLTRPTVLPYDILQSIDFVFLYNTSNISHISMVYNQFSANFKFYSFKSFLEQVKNLNPVTECLVVKLRSYSQNIKDHLFINFLKM